MRVQYEVGGKSKESPGGPSRLPPFPELAARAYTIEYIDASSPSCRLDWPSCRAMTCSRRR
jgi:hypothetical protein